MSTDKRVFIQGPGAAEYARMFITEGYALTRDIELCDIICFTGGADVNPSRYNEHALANTYFDEERDVEDELTYFMGYGMDKFMVGICRGGQFLNVMNGGRMWQHVDNHGRSHYMTDVASGNTIWASSTHHQMMRPTAEAEILATASEAFNKHAWMEKWQAMSGTDEEDPDIEVVYYKDTRSLCFQPHPEFQGFAECRQYLFNNIKAKMAEPFTSITKKVKV